MNIEHDAPEEFSPPGTPSAESQAMQPVPKEVEAERSSLVVQARALKIVDQESYEQGCALQLHAATLEKTIEQFFEPMREATWAAYQSVLQRKKEALTPVLEAKQLMSRSTADFQIAQERIRQEEQRKRDEAARLEAEAKRKAEIEAAKKEGASKKDLKAMEQAPLEVEAAPAVEPTYEKAAGISKPIEDWSAEVEDLLELCKAVAAGKQPIIAILPNQKYLDQQARSLKNLLRIPGVRPKVSYRTSTRTARG